MGEIILEENRQSYHTEDRRKREKLLVSSGTGANDPEWRRETLRLFLLAENCVVAERVNTAGNRRGESFALSAYSSLQQSVYTIALLAWPDNRNSISSSSKWKLVFGRLSWQCHKTVSLTADNSKESESMHGRLHIESLHKSRCMFKGNGKEGALMAATL